MARLGMLRQHFWADMSTSAWAGKGGGCAAAAAAFELSSIGSRKHQQWQELLRLLCREYSNPPQESRTYKPLYYTRHHSTIQSCLKKR